MNIINKNIRYILLLSIISFVILSFFFSKDEIKNRFISHDNIENIAQAYNAFKNNMHIDSYLNDLLTIENNPKGKNGKSLNFYYKSKTNCLNMFKKIKPLYFETREREYRFADNPKPARVCHTNYDFGQLNFIKIYN